MPSKNNTCSFLNVLKNIWNAIEFDVGVGGGIRVGLSIANIGADIGYSANPLQLHLDDGKFSFVQSFSVKCEIDIIIMSLGYSHEELQTLNWDLIKEEDTWGQSGTISFVSLVAYPFVGGSINLGFNWYEFGLAQFGG